MYPLESVFIMKLTEHFTLQEFEKSATADKYHTDMEAARKWIDFIEHNTDFDQVILETANDKDYWIHVSCRKNRRANRHRVIRYMKKK